MMSKGGKMTADESKQALLRDLVEVRGHILEAVSGVAEQYHEEIFLGEWSLRDLLAHLAGWDVTNRQAVQELLRGELPGFYAHRGRDWASYNAMLVAKYGGGDFRQLIELLRQTHRDLMMSLVQVPAEEFDRDRGVRAHGYIVLISRLLQTELDDEREHLEQIVMFAAEKQRRQ